jgi:hypothetical protein
VIQSSLPSPCPSPKTSPLPFVVYASPFPSLMMWVMTELSEQRTRPIVIERACPVQCLLSLPQYLQSSCHLHRMMVELLVAVASSVLAGQWHHPVATFQAASRARLRFHCHLFPAPFAAVHGFLLTAAFVVRMPAFPQQRTGSLLCISEVSGLQRQLAFVDDNKRTLYEVTNVLKIP